MKTTVFAALIALASTLFLVGCGTAAIGTAGRPNTQIQIDTSVANASTIPAACVALQRQFVLLHQHIQEAKSGQHELTAPELAAAQAQQAQAQAQQAQVQARLQRCIAASTTSTTSFHDNCTSLLGQIKTLQNEARFIKYGLHDVVLDQSEIKARQASLTAVQVQIAQLQEKLLTCS